MKKKITVLTITFLLISTLFVIVQAKEPGALKWRYETGDYVDSSPAIASDGMVYVGSSDGYWYLEE